MANFPNEYFIITLAMSHFNDFGTNSAKRCQLNAKNIADCDNAFFHRFFTVIKLFKILIQTHELFWNKENIICLIIFWRLDSSHLSTKIFFQTNQTEPAQNDLCWPLSKGTIFRSWNSKKGQQLFIIFFFEFFKI